MYKFDLEINGKIPIEQVKAGSSLKAAFPPSVMLTPPKTAVGLTAQNSVTGDTT